MKTILLNKNVNPKVCQPFFLKDTEGSIKSCVPGEWVYLVGANKRRVCGYVNPFHQDELVAWGLPCEEIESAEAYIKKSLQTSIERRLLMGLDLKSSRLFYGQSDGLPGLVIDSYQNICVVQINTMGVALFRDYIKDILSSDYQLNVFFMQNPNQDRKELIPEFETQKLPDIKVVDNGFQFLIPSEFAQKAGYYYDHSLNRKKMLNFLKNSTLKVSKAIDLFSYCGSWGVHALSAIDGEMLFVDQSKIGESIQNNLELNNIVPARGRFFHSDVFKFLSNSFSKKESYQLVIADPPAFAKNIKQKKIALNAYQKLIQHMIKVCDQKAFLVLGSCTHGVSLDELDQLVNSQVEKANRRLMLIELGSQRADHPTSSLKSRESYVKFLMYYLF